MAGDVHVFVNRQELVGYTDLKLIRSKSEMTGQLTISVFMGWLPTEAVMGDVQSGNEILVYIGGHLAFSGTLDRRNASGTKDSYTVSFTARGKTKQLVDSSHQHSTGTILAPTNRQVFETLIEPFNVVLDWQADTISMNRIRLRDGARVNEELQRVAEMFSLYVHETRDGRLRVTDAAGAETGEGLSLGTNILSFQADQDTDQARNQILVKGQLTSKEVWGASALLPTLKRVTDASVAQFSPLTVNLYGDATVQLIDRRAQYEMNKRTAASKKVHVDVFHLQQTDGAQWDIGTHHYVEIPPEGIIGNFEVTGITYEVENDKKLSTKLTLSPMITKMAEASDNASVTGSLPEISVDRDGLGSRAATFQVGDLVNNWLSPALSEATAVVSETAAEILATVEDAADAVLGVPPLTLPPGFVGAVNT